MTAAQKQKFLAELAYSGNLAFAAAAAEVAVGAALTHRDSDREFEAGWRRAEDKARRRFRRRAGV